MPAYATIEQLKARTTRTFTADEETVINSMLSDAGLLIDAYNAEASADAKQYVSIQMVLRALPDDDGAGVPMGATQGSMAAGGYSQSWTIGSGGAANQLYISKAEKKILGVGDRIGSKSPVEYCGPGLPPWWFPIDPGVNVP